MHDPMGLPHALHAARSEGPVARGLRWACQAMAISGGALFMVLIGMSLVSIVGRKLGFGPVSGDIELMQCGTAAAACAFLPYCTWLGEHIRVDFFTEGLDARIKRPIDGLTDLLLAGVAALLCWRTVLAAQNAHENGDVTTLVSLPIWIPTAAILPALALMALCALYRAATAFVPGLELPEVRDRAIEAAEAAEAGQVQP